MGEPFFTVGTCANAACPTLMHSGRAGCQRGSRFTASGSRCERETGIEPASSAWKARQAHPNALIRIQTLLVRLSRTARYASPRAVRTSIGRRRGKEQLRSVCSSGSLVAQPIPSYAESGLIAAPVGRWRNNLWVAIRTLRAKLMKPHPKDPAMTIRHRPAAARAAVARKASAMQMPTPFGTSSISPNSSAVARIRRATR